MNFIQTIINSDLQTNALLITTRNTTATKTFSLVTLLGESYIIIILALLAAIILWKIHKHTQIITLWFAVLSSAGTTFLAKLIFHRARPINAILTENSSSFPSAHATVSVAFYGFLAYLLFKNTKSKFVRFLIILFAFILIAVIGFSRLYLGVHYLSDVCVGYLVGLLWLIISITINESKIFNKKIKI